MTTKMNQDDALGAETGGEAYDDQQGVFTAGGRPSGRSGEQPAASGGGAAKLFLFGFVGVLVLCIGWFGWKVAHRNSAPDASVSIPVTDASSLPMTGPPVEENTRRAAPTPVAPAAMVPTTGALGPRTASLAPVSAAAPMPSSQAAAVALGTPPSPQPAAASTALTGAVAPAAQTQAMPATTQPAATASAASQAQLRDQLEDTIRRVEALEREVAALTPGERSKARLSTEPHHRAAPRSHAPTEVASSRHAPPAKAVPTAPPGVILKAVVEGRAWLQLRSGDTITVAPGDSVPGLGAVSSIDAEREEVRFADGVVLK